MDFFGWDLCNLTFEEGLRVGFYKNSHLTEEEFEKIKKDIFPEEFI